MQWRFTLCSCCAPPAVLEVSSIRFWPALHSLLHPDNCPVAKWRWDWINFVVAVTTPPHPHNMHTSSIFLSSMFGMSFLHWSEEDLFEMEELWAWLCVCVYLLCCCSNTRRNMTHLSKGVFVRADWETRREHVLTEKRKNREKWHWTNSSGWKIRQQKPSIKNDGFAGPRVRTQWMKC